MEYNYNDLETNFQNLLKQIKTRADAVKVKDELDTLDDYFERHAQIRSMHIQTLTGENNELKTKNKELSVKNNELLKRVVSVREKCLVRKFQSRFWMFMTLACQIQIFFPNTTKYVFTQHLYPAAFELIYGETFVALSIRFLGVLYLNYQWLKKLYISDDLKKLRNLFC